MPNNLLTSTTPRPFLRPASAGAELVFAALAERFGDRLSRSQAVRDQHGKDVSYHPAAAPDAVLFAESTEDVSFTVGLCHAHRVPVIAFGTGTSCEGHVAALEGGVCIDLSRMDRILRVGQDDLDCTVQPGVTRKQLNAHLHDSGLFFPIDPGADASIGGMCATRASGTNAVRYGTMRENVLALEVVLADGRVVRTGTRARKSSAGYDLTRLMVGSEGTLGILTEITLKLHPVPETISAAVASFEALKDPVDAVIQIIQLGVPIARVELLDEVQIAAVNSYSKLDLAERPTLFFEFHGSPESVDAQVETVRAVCADHRSGDFEWASTPEARSRMWQARHDIWWATLALRPGSQGFPTDSCVPLSRLTEAVLAAREDVAELNLIAPMCGHVGDGNFHLCVLIDPDDQDEMDRAQELNARLIHRAIAFGGTCTGEHGIGYGKIDFLVEEHGDAVGAMAALKRALDPRGILNPGKILDLARWPDPFM